MFGSLKEKLKGWIKKSEDSEIEENLEESKIKKEIKKDKLKSDVEKSSKKQKKAKISSKETKESIQIGEIKIEKSLEVEEDIEKAEIVEDLTQGEEIKEAPKEKKSFFGSFKRTVTEEKFEELFQDLELILLQNNVAYEAVEGIKEELSERVIDKGVKEVNLSEELKNSIDSILINPPSFLDEIKNSLKNKTPFVILLCGINGSGKTTTVAKLANYLRKNNLSVCLAAADTFRAASIEQIQTHADNLEIQLIKKDYGSDPAAVGFEGIKYAKKNKIDVVLIDTAGRMQNKDSLMKEIEKIVKITSPDMKIYLGESITGNDATRQAKAFDEAINLTGIILSKADVDEKGGTAISVSKVTNKPILFLGTGQNYEDLEIFNKEKLIEKLGL